MRDYDFRLTANAAAVVEAQGSRLVYKTGSETNGNTGIIVTSERGGLEILLLPGEGVRLPQSVGRWSIKKASAASGTIDGALVIGDGDFIASRVQGDVNVLNAEAFGDRVDGASTVGNQLMRFRSCAFLSHGTAASHHAYRLLNPSGSGRLIVARRARLSRSSGKLYGSKQGVFTIGVSGLVSPFTTLFPPFYAEGNTGSRIGSVGGQMFVDDAGGLEVSHTEAIDLDEELKSQEMISDSSPVVLRAGQSLTFVSLGHEIFSRSRLHIAWTERVL